MTRIPTFARNTRGQLTHTGYRLATPDELKQAAAHTADQLSIDIKRFYADAQKRADVRGFKESQKFLREKAWRADYVKPAGELRGFDAHVGRCRQVKPVQVEQVAA